MGREPASGARPTKSQRRLKSKERKFFHPEGRVTAAARYRLTELGALGGGAMLKCVKDKRRCLCLLRRNGSSGSKDRT